MKCKVVGVESREEWNDYFARLPIGQQDVYYTPEYYEVYELLGSGKATCFCFESGGEFAIYPFLMNSINELGYELDGQYLDIQGAYGYNGVVASSYDLGFRKEFFAEFNNYCDAQRIVAEFVRFNPVLKNHEFCVGEEPVYALDNVLIDTGQPIEEIWTKSFGRKVRRAVKRGLDNGLIFEWHLAKDMDSQLIDEFLKVYYSTLDRHRAADFYYFSKDFVASIIRHLSGEAIFCFVRHEHEVISVELDFCKNLNAYGFLGGTLSEYFALSPNSFLRFELIKVLKTLGVKNYSIGGGISKGDSIYNFKKSFSVALESKFYIGKFVHCRNVYDEIIRQWVERNAEHALQDDDILLRYRDRPF